MKKTKKAKKLRSAVQAKKPKTAATDVKIITEDDLLVVTGGVIVARNAVDQI